MAGDFAPLGSADRDFVAPGSQLPENSTDFNFPLTYHQPTDLTGNIIEELIGKVVVADPPPPIHPRDLPRIPFYEARLTPSPTRVIPSRLERHIALAPLTSNPIRKTTP